MLAVTSDRDAALPLLESVSDLIAEYALWRLAAVMMKETRRSTGTGRRCHAVRLYQFALLSSASGEAAGPGMGLGIGQGGKTVPLTHA